MTFQCMSGHGDTRCRVNVSKEKSCTNHASLHISQFKTTCDILLMGTLEMNILWYYLAVIFFVSIRIRHRNNVILYEGEQTK